MDMRDLAAGGAWGRSAGPVAANTAGVRLQQQGGEADAQDTDDDGEGRHLRQRARGEPVLLLADLEVAGDLAAHTAAW